MYRERVIVAGAFIIVIIASIIMACKVQGNSSNGEYEEWVYPYEEEFKKQEFVGILSGYERELLVINSEVYWPKTRDEYEDERYESGKYIKISESQRARNGYIAEKTGDYEVYYYSLEEVEPFYVGICITDEEGNLLYHGISNVNNRQALGRIHLEKKKEYYTDVFYLLDKEMIQRYESLSGDKVSKLQYPTYTKQEWYYIEMCTVKAVQQ